MTKAEYEKALEKLFDRIIYCDNNLMTFVRFTELFNGEVKYRRVFNRTKNFFVMVVHNMSAELITELSRLYDKHSFGIEKVINIFEQNQDWFTYTNEFEHILSVIKTSYNDMAASIIKLKSIRDSNLAHVDKKYIFNSNEIYEGFTWGDVERLVATAFEICNHISCALSDKYYLNDMSVVRDIDTLVELARVGITNDIK